MNLIEFLLNLLRVDTTLNLTNFKFANIYLNENFYTNRKGNICFILISLLQQVVGTVISKYKCKAMLIDLIN